MIEYHLGKGQLSHKRQSPLDSLNIVETLQKQIATIAREMKKRSQNTLDM